MKMGPEKIHQKSPTKFNRKFVQKESPRISAEALSRLNHVVDATTTLKRVATNKHIAELDFEVIADRAAEPS